MIDVSELMADPDFVQEIPILRRTEVLTKGRASHPETPDTIYGSVQPATSGELSVKLPEGTQLSDTIFVYTASDLRALKDGGYGDIVVDEGKRYQVFAIDEAFRRFGYNRAVAISESPGGKRDAQ